MPGSAADRDAFQRRTVSTSGKRERFKLETNSAGRRGAGGLETGGFGGRGNGSRMAEMGLDSLYEGPGCRPLGVRPASGGDGAATVVIADTGVAEEKLSGF